MRTREETSWPDEAPTPEDFEVDDPYDHDVVAEYRTEYGSSYLGIAEFKGCLIAFEASSDVGQQVLGVWPVNAPGSHDAALAACDLECNETVGYQLYEDLRRAREECGGAPWQSDTLVTMLRGCTPETVVEQLEEVVPDHYSVLPSVPDPVDLIRRLQAGQAPSTQREREFAWDLTSALGLADHQGHALGQSLNSSYGAGMEPDDAIWDAYGATMIVAMIDGSMRPLSGESAGALPAAEPLFVLTAFNPDSELQDEAANEQAQDAIERDLKAVCEASWPAVGQSSDGSWSERSIAVAGIDRAIACEVGRRYGQLAIFELTDDEVRVVRCGDLRIMRALPRVAKR